MNVPDKLFILVLVNFFQVKYGSLQRLRVFSLFLVLSFEMVGVLSSVYPHQFCLSCALLYINGYDHFPHHRQWTGQRTGTKQCSNRSTRFTKQVSLEGGTPTIRIVPLFHVIWSSDMMRGIGHACMHVRIFVCLCMCDLVKAAGQQKLRARAH